MHGDGHRPSKGSVGLVVALVLVAGGLDASRPAPAAAFEADLHEKATFALAVASGWSPEQAAVIAATAQAVDENAATVAPADLDADPAPPGSWLELHCISATRDQVRAASFDPSEPYDPWSDPVDPGRPFGGARPAKDVRADDVRAVLAARQRDVESALASAARSGSPMDRTRALIAAGAFFHCQQDSWSHNGFGALPQGHALAGHAPDRPSLQPRTDPALHEQAVLLGHFLAVAGGTPAGLADGHVDRLVSAVTDRDIGLLDNNLAGPFGDYEEQRLATSALVSRWLAFVLARTGRADVCRSGPVCMLEPLDEAFGLRRADNSPTAEGRVVRRVVRRHFPDEPLESRRLGVRVAALSWPALSEGARPVGVFDDGGYTAVAESSSAPFVIECIARPGSACVVTTPAHEDLPIGAGCPAPFLRRAGPFRRLVDVEAGVGDATCPNTNRLLSGPVVLRSVEATSMIGRSVAHLVVGTDRDNDHVFGEPAEAEGLLEGPPSALAGRRLELHDGAAHLVATTDRPAFVRLVLVSVR